MVEAPSETASESSWTARLTQGLARTRARLSGLFGDRAIDEALYEEIETALLAGDAGVEATRFLLARLRERAGDAATAGDLRSVLRTILVELLSSLERPLELPDEKPCVIMLAGVNGAGKTTSAGKLAKYFLEQGRSVLLAAGEDRKSTRLNSSHLGISYA